MVIRLLVSTTFFIKEEKSFNNFLNFLFLVFIAEKGPECFTEKKDGIINCVNSTFSHYIPEKAPTSENLKELVIGQEQCK